MTHWKLLDMSIPCLFYRSSKQLYFLFWKCLIIFWELRSTLTTKIENPFAVLRICADANNNKKKPCLFFLHLLQHGWKFWRREDSGTNLSEPRGGWKMWCSAVRRWNPLSDHAEQWQQPQHTRKNISRCSPHRITNPPSHTDTHLWATHGLHIMEAWSQSSHFSSCPHLFTYCTCAVRPARTELLRPFSCLCYFRQQEDNKMSSLIRNIY